MSLVAGTETQVNTYFTDTQEHPSITSLSDGGWVVTWASYGQDGSSYAVYQQRYTAEGNKTGDEIKANVTTA